MFDKIIFFKKNENFRAITIFGTCANERYVLLGTCGKKRIVDY